MFIDYYAILDVDIEATPSEIKAAFKKQAIRWHPDKNAGKDTTLRMQQLNEANLILKDPEARLRYNEEYKRFKQHQQNQQKTYNSRNQNNERARTPEGEKTTGQEQTFSYSDYIVVDDVLNKWMGNAKQQAVDLAKKSLEDLIGISSVGLKAAGNEALAGISRYLIFGLIISVIIVLMRSCGN